MARNSALTNAHSGRRMVFITIGALVIITIAGALFIFHSMRVGSERWALKLVDEPSPIWGALHQTHPTAMRIKLAFVTDYDGADASTLTETAHAFNKRLLWKSLISKRAPESTLMLYIPAQSSPARSLSWLLPSILPTVRRKLTSLKTTSECHLVICPASGVDRWTFIPRKPLMKLQGRSEEYSRQKTWYAHLRATSIKPIATIQTSLHQLPDCPADYSSVDTIWLSHSQLWRLTRAQLNALNAWLYGGGVLVLDATRLDERSISLVQRLWNLRILGKGAMVSPQVLGDALPTSVRIPPVRYPTVKVALKDNWEVALAEGRTPLVIERKFGYGRIIALLM
ncbi:MAG TPA: hypothetical protein EYP10_09135, partial [Armatimonadetes bacterium]|nr:hypothetical protein [Armatimonadota bacterium]